MITKRKPTQGRKERKERAQRARFSPSTILLISHHRHPTTLQKRRCPPPHRWAPPQMGPRTRTPRAFRSTTGGQRDFFWFPKFDKNKQTNKNLILIPLILLGGSPTCRIQSNLSLIELISTLSVHSCRCGDAFPLQLLLLTVWTQTPRL